MPIGARGRRNKLSRHAWRQPMARKRGNYINIESGEIVVVQCMKKMQA